MFCKLRHGAQTNKCENLDEVSRNFYVRWQNASCVLAMARASVCLSVSPSVTLCDCKKTVQAKITKSKWADKILCPWVRGYPSNDGVKEGYP